MGCALAVTGFLLAGAALVFTGGQAFWVIVIARWAFGVSLLRVGVSCSSVWGFRAQKYNGWGSCTLTYSSATNKNYYCNYAY